MNLKQELDRLFVKSGRSFRETLFDSTVRTFGHGCAFGLQDERLPRDDEWAGPPLDDVPMFMLAASSDEGSGFIGGATLNVNYHLARRNLNKL